MSSRTMTSVSPASPTRMAPAGVHTPSDARRLARASDSVCPKSSRAVKYKSYRNPWLRYGTVNSTIPSPPPTITFLNVTSDSPKDPVASNPWTVSICFETSEPVQTPEVVLTGETLTPAMLSGGGTRWCAGPRVVLPGDIAHTDENKCVTFAVTLTDLAGNVAEPITALIGAEGSDNCPTTRVELDLAPPVFLWLQTNTITSTDMTFDVALNEFARVFYVAVPEGSAEPTPDEVVEDAGPMTASSMVTFPDMSSAMYSVSSPPIPNQLYPGRSE